jgi:hypothetical protein
LIETRPNRDESKPPRKRFAPRKIAYTEFFLAEWRDGAMPTYDYRCNATGEVFEVKHRMSEHLSSWGELCERAGLDPGDVPRDSPVTRLATGGQVVKSANLGERGSPCGAGACGSGMCGMN